MPLPQDPAFEQFVTQRKKDLQRIARHTQNEHEYFDVVGEAWLMASELTMRKGIVIDFLNPSFQELLISHLYQHLVRYTELNVRRAIRLDHGTPGMDQDDESHPLMHILGSDDGSDPLTMLIEREAASDRNFKVDAHHSLAGAYICLLGHFDNKMRAVAAHLLISVSYAYRRCRQARLLAVYQNPMPMPASSEPFMPGPWRRFQLRKPWVQLVFDFEEELPL